MTLVVSAFFCAAGVLLALYPVSGWATTLSPANWLTISTGAALMLIAWAAKGSGEPH